jgi:hypothetical protein
MTTVDHRGTWAVKHVFKYRDIIFPKELRQIIYHLEHGRCLFKITMAVMSSIKMDSIIIIRNFWK